MVEVTTPALLDGDFATMLQLSKSDFVSSSENGVVIAQQGAARIEADGWPGWPALPSALDAAEPVIETYVASAEGILATSDNEPFVGAWTPLTEWVNTAVRSALGAHGIELDGDAYATASLTATDQLEGMAHMDDDGFVPNNGVGVVAIVGQLVGPRVATGKLSIPGLRPMSQVLYSDTQLQDFEADLIDHCACAPDQLVLFPQFGQLHAGPSATTTRELATQRQLLVYRASVARP